MDCLVSRIASPAISDLEPVFELDLERLTVLCSMETRRRTSYPKIYYSLETYLTYKIADLDLRKKRVSSDIRQLSKYVLCLSFLSFHFDSSKSPIKKDSALCSDDECSTPTIKDVIYCDEVQTTNIDICVEPKSELIDKIIDLEKNIFAQMEDIQKLEREIDSSYRCDPRVSYHYILGPWYHVYNYSLQFLADRSDDIINCAGINSCDPSEFTQYCEIAYDHEFLTKLGKEKFRMFLLSR